jgi:pyruvate dehydrogenase E2 component (dihydrolipoamide acetyltransferase)
VAIEVTMPQMGADMTEGTLVKWFKKVGETVNRGEILAEIETDKANVELEAFEGGTLIKLVASEGDIVPVGETIALLGAADEAAPDVERKAPPGPAKRDIEPEAKAASSAPAEAPAATTVVAPAEPPKPATDGRVRISPVARKIAEEAGFDFAAVKGTGPDGRILRKDVETAMAAGPAAKPAPQLSGAEPAEAEPAGAKPTKVEATEPGPTKKEAPAAAAATSPAGTTGLSRMRQAIAHRMALSKQTQPHYYLTLDVDMTPALEFRSQINANATEQQRVSINDLIVKACAIALERHPKFNAEFHDTGLKMHVRVNICIGIALDDGLIAPALLDCQSKSLGRIAVEAKDLIERAKSGHLRAEEYGEGTFTITNLGAYGVETLIGIINPPQAAILGVGSVMAKAVVREDQVVVRQVMKIALSGDHRVTDGAEGARFIKEIQQILEAPAALAL